MGIPNSAGPSGVVDLATQPAGSQRRLTTQTLELVNLPS